MGQENNYLFRLELTIIPPSGKSPRTYAYGVINKSGELNQETIRAIKKGLKKIIKKIILNKDNKT